MGAWGRLPSAPRTGWRPFSPHWTLQCCHQWCSSLTHTHTHTIHNAIFKHHLIFIDLKQCTSSSTPRDSWMFNLVVRLGFENNKIPRHFMVYVCNKESKIFLKNIFKIWIKIQIQISQNKSTFYAKLIIIIYHDFLPTPRRGSHVKSGKTHTQSSRYTP